MMNPPSTYIRKLRISPWFVILAITLLVSIYLLLPQLGEFRKSLTILGTANLLFVATALACTFVGFPLSTIIQIIAAGNKGGFRDVLIMQTAGSFINCFLPFSVGATTLLTEYYRAITKSRAHAFVIAYSPVLFNIGLSLLLVALISPITLARISVELDIGPFIQWLIPVIIFITILLIVAFVAYWSHIKRTVNQFIEGFQAVSDLRIVTAMVFLSLVSIILNGTTLWLCAAALHLPFSFINAVILFLASYFVGGIVPTPGGIGATEATLVVGLTGSGLSLTDSVATTLLFRLVTFWLPLLPGALALQTLGRRQLREHAL